MKKNTIRVFLWLEGILVGIPLVILIISSVLEATLPGTLPNVISGPLFFGFVFYRLPALLLVPPLRTMQMHWIMHYVCVFLIHSMIVFAVALVIGWIKSKTRTAEPHARQVSSEAAPSASPNEPSA